MFSALTSVSNLTGLATVVLVLGSGYFLVSQFRTIADLVRAQADLTVALKATQEIAVADQARLATRLRTLETEVFGGLPAAIKSNEARIAKQQDAAALANRAADLLARIKALEAYRLKSEANRGPR